MPNVPRANARARPTLGVPTEREQIGEGREMLSYEAVVTKELESGVFLLYSGEKTVRKNVVSRLEFEEEAGYSGHNAGKSRS